MTIRPLWTFFGIGLFAAGCFQSADGSNEGQGASGGVGSGAGSAEGDFLSDGPPGSNTGDNGTDAGGGASAAPEAGDDADKGDAERAIAEADIIQRDGDVLYALSQYSGLSVIDLSDPNDLTLLGRYESSAYPFEMYLRDGVVYAMFNSYWDYVKDASGNWTWVQTSHIEALDVSNPAAITKLGSFNLPGTVSDSRTVGDVLYVVTQEDGYCWGCQSAPNTTVTSLAVGDVSNIAVIDSLTYTSSPETVSYGWWRRSVYATDERLYVAGLEWNGNWGDQESGHSTIQVIDISDPAGDLVEGAKVEVKGQIESRWQMDEHEGVLRVISQPGAWWSNGVPSVQTFQVNSSVDMTPLGNLDLTLPMPEDLRSARFDGDRAYAITAVQTDPLFTIDLSNPALPLQKGELEMPGWVYHMEPRGDRLLALGFDNQSTEGSLHVSLFNVADMTNPTLIKRVHFGGNWSWLGEDQDRIHKAFRIFDDEALVVVPYSGWNYSETEEGSYGCGSYDSGIQLIDWENDDLIKRGAAKIAGAARRAFLHEGNLIGVSDEAVRAFNIGNRDLPTQISDLKLADHVSKTAVVGSTVVKLAADWWSSDARLETASIADPENPVAVGSLDLSPLASSTGCGLGNLSSGQLFTVGQSVVLVWPGADWDKTRVATISVANPASPVILDQEEFDFRMYNWNWNPGRVSTGSNIVQAGSALVFLNQPQQDYYYEGDIDDSAAGGADAQTQAPEATTLEVVSLKTPSNIQHGATVTLNETQGLSNLHAVGSTVYFSHYVPAADKPGKVRFYVNRYSVTNPSSPLDLGSVNVPGTLAAIHAPTGRMLTMSYTDIPLPNADSSLCWQTFAEYEWTWDQNGYGDYENGDCVGKHRTFHLLDVGATAVIASSLPVANDQTLYSLYVGTDRLFAYDYGYNYGWAESDDSGAYEYSGRVWTLGGLETGTLAASLSPLTGTTYASPVATSGNRLVLQSWSPTSLYVLNATGEQTPTLGDAIELDTYGYIYEVNVEGDNAYCSLGPWGLEVVSLE